MHHKKNTGILILALVIIMIAVGFIYFQKEDYAPGVTGTDPAYTIEDEFVQEVNPITSFREALEKSSKVSGESWRRTQISEPTPMIEILENEEEFMFLRAEIQDFMGIRDEETMQELWIKLIQEGRVGEWETILAENMYLNKN
jgi:hypothetical protein